METKLNFKQILLADLTAAGVATIVNVILLLFAILGDNTIAVRLSQKH